MVISKVENWISAMEMQTFIGFVQVAFWFKDLKFHKMCDFIHNVAFCEVQNEVLVFLNKKMGGH